MEPPSVTLLLLLVLGHFLVKVSHLKGFSILVGTFTMTTTRHDMIYPQNFPNLCLNHALLNQHLLLVQQHLLRPPALQLSERLPFSLELSCDEKHGHDMTGEIFAARTFARVTLLGTTDLLPRGS